MAYVEWHDTVRNHPKTDALMLALEIKRREAVGIIGCLSSWAIQYRPGGRIERAYVHVAVEWEGDAKRLLNALLASRWIDAIDDTWIAIHDWKDITRGYRKARADAARKKRERRATVHGQSVDSPRTEARSSVDISGTAPRSELNELNRAELSGTERAEGRDDAPAQAHSWEDQQVLVWNKHPNSQPISMEKGARLIRVALSRKAKRVDIEKAVWDPNGCAGKKLWEVLDIVTPPPSDHGPRRKSWTDVLADLNISGEK